MRICPKCGGESKEGAKFCRSCGFAFPTDALAGAHEAPASVPTGNAPGGFASSSSGNSNTGFTIVSTQSSSVSESEEAKSENKQPPTANKNFLILAGVAIMVVILAVVLIASLNKDHQPSGDNNNQVQTAQTDTSGQDAQTDTSEYPGATGSSNQGGSPTQQSMNGAGPTENMDAPDHIMFPNSSTQTLTESDLKPLSAWELSVARNEIYARHGFIFVKNMQIKSYFAGKSWYHENPSFKGADSELNSVEIANIRLIQSWESRVRQ